MYRRFGSEVTVVETGPRLVAREDEDVRPPSATSSSGEGIAVRLNAECIARQQAGGAHRRRTWIASEGDPRDHRHAPAARGRAHRPTPTTSASTRAGDRHRRAAATSGSTTRCARPRRASGRWATATAAAPSRTRRTTTTRSSPPTSSTTIHGGVSDRIPTYALFIDPPLGRAGMTSARRSGADAGCCIGTLADDPVGRARERGETQGFMKIVVDAASEAHTRRGATRHRRRRG